jgi:hypothetical protein
MAVIITGSNTPTAGGVTYGDGTTYANTAAGTAGQILQSNGSSAPSWVAAPGGGSWIYLSTVNASAAATADIESTFDSTYDVYAIVAEDFFPATDGAQLYVRLKIGGSYVANTYYGVYGNAYSNDTTQPINANSNNGFIQIATEMSNASNKKASFVLYTTNPTSTSIYKSVFMAGAGFRNTGSAAAWLMCSGYYGGATSALTGIRFYANSGNISGTFRLYGIKNS